MLRRQSRIIPILLRDISDVTDKVDVTLRQVIAAAGLSYLEWPGTDDSKKEARFWEKLRLCMPKRKIVDGQDDIPD